MPRSSFAKSLLVVATLIGPNAALAADNDATAVIDKGIAALGGEAKLVKATALKWKVEGKLTVEGNDNNFSVRYVTQGIDRSKVDFEGEINGNEIKGGTVLDGNKGWRSFGETNALDADAVDNEKRNAYLQIIPIVLVPVKGVGFKAESGGESKVNDKPVSVVKVTGPDGRTCKLSFDKETGLPVRMEATVVGFGGDDYEQVTLFKDYKDFGGIQKATKLELTRDGKPFLNVTVKEFAVVDQLPADTFGEPK